MLELILKIVSVYLLFGHSVWMIGSICVIADPKLEEEYFDEHRADPLWYEMFQAWLTFTLIWPCVIKDMVN